jgi:hypothetical protein
LVLLPFLTTDHRPPTTARYGFVELRARPELSFMPPLRGLAVESVAPLGFAPALGFGVLLGGEVLDGALDALPETSPGDVVDAPDIEPDGGVELAPDGEADDVSAWWPVLRPV